MASFSTIASHLDLIGQKVEAITNACTEQESGLEQTNLAMNQIEKGSQNISQIATETENLAFGLGKQSLKLKSVIKSINNIVKGPERS